MYSPEVAQREQQGLGRLAPGLTRTAAREDIPKPPLFPDETTDPSPAAVAFRNAVKAVHQDRPEDAKKVFQNFAPGYITSA